MAEVSARKKSNFRASLCIPYLVFMILFVIVPLILIVVFAFSDENNHFTFSNWGTVFANPDNWKIIGMSFVVAAATTVVSPLSKSPVFVNNQSVFTPASYFRSTVNEKTYTYPAEVFRMGYADTDGLFKGNTAYYKNYWRVNNIH